LQQVLRKKGKLVLLSFTDCRVTHKDKTLFEPEWGVFDMAVGEKITSVFSGPADPEGFGLQYEAPTEKTHQIDYDEKSRQLHQLYSSVREIRESAEQKENLLEIEKRLESEFGEDWLLPVEILELARANQINGDLEERIVDHLRDLENKKPSLSKLIENGIVLA
jgi:phenylalanine-4-hydroxylase